MSTRMDASWWSTHGPAARLVRSLRARRLAKNLTQSALAREMSNMGFPWHPTTVARLESAERDLSLDEAVALAGLLGVSLVDLIRSEPRPLRERIEAVQEQLAQATVELAQAREMQQRVSAEVERVEERTAQLHAMLRVLRSQLGGGEPAPDTNDQPPLLAQ